MAYSYHTGLGTALMGRAKGYRMGRCALFAQTRPGARCGIVTAVDPESASRQVTTLVSAGALVTFLPLLVISLLLARPMANRFRARFSVTLLTLVSLAAILAATFRGQDLMMWLSHVSSGGGLAENAFGWLTDGESWRRVTHVDPGWLLNLALFVPAGILLALVTRRPLSTHASG